MSKKIFKIIIITFCIILLNGCKKDENKATMTAYTSVYPVEYILENLYGDSIAIYSIYPDGIKYNEYSLTDKQLNDYSKGDLYIYNSTIINEKNYAVDLINMNRKIKVIDASLGMNYNNKLEESWLNPSNYLMMASNIKNGLEEYITETIELKKIEKNYNELKLSLSEIDAELKMIASNSNNNVLVVSDDTFKYLEKYGFTVVSLEENENLTDKVIADVKEMLANKMVHYIFLKDNEKESELIKNLKNTYGVQTVSLNSLTTLTVNDRKDKKDYLSIMLDNINSIKLEVNH